MSRVNGKNLLLTTIGAILLVAVAAPSSYCADTGGGTIYYYGPWAGATGGGTTAMWAMGSDGSNKRQLGRGIWGTPSLALYNNHRWFVDTRSFPNQYYPDGSIRFGVFIFRDDFDFFDNNTAANKIQLTSDLTLQPIGQTTYATKAWVPGGQQLSWVARRWSNGVVVEEGIYTAPLAFDVDGNPTGLAAPPVLTFSFPVWTDFTGYDWKPNGSQIAYGRSTGLYLADLLGNPHTRIAPFSRAPAWAPDGTKIAFNNGSGGISTIRSNGTSPKEIIRRTSVWVYDKACWSPTGSHLACYGGRQQAIDSDVFRATATGGSLTNLTSTADPFVEWAVGWR